MNYGTFAFGILIGIAAGLVIKKSIYKQKPSLTDQKAQEHAQMIERAISFTHDKDEITNDELEKHLNISDATAERYLNELEKQGILKQIGKTGHSVSYKVL